MAIEVRRIGPDDRERLKAVRLAALADSPSAFGSTLEREVAFTDDLVHRVSMWTAPTVRRRAGRALVHQRSSAKVKGSVTYSAPLRTSYGVVSSQRQIDDPSAYSPAMS